jgi:hypothetical protein
MNGANLLHAARRDGVIVKPDVPLTPIDSSYRSAAHGANDPQMAATYTDFGALRAYYVFAYGQGSNAPASFSPSDFGLDKPAYLYDYFAGAGQVVNPSDALVAPLVNSSLYLIAAPIGPSGMAVLGDLQQFVPLGKKRVSSLVDDGVVHVTVVFANGEDSRLITGYSPYRPVARASRGAIGPITYDKARQQFQIPVKPGPDGTASIRIRKPRPHLAAPPRQPVALTQ